MTLSASQVAELMQRHGLHPSRALGQNFVVDPNTVRRIARLAGVGEGDKVVEIGAGLGSLTLALLETGAEVVTVELDRYLIPVLEEVVAPHGARVVQGDALNLDWAALLGEPPWVLVANLPYNVATMVVADLLDEVPAISRMLVMVQREVGERMAATVGSSAYGALSVKIAYWAQASLVGRVPSTVFLPQPKVESSLVAIERLVAPAVDPNEVDPVWLFTLVRAGFAQRRKMLRRSLASLVAPEAFVAAGIRPEARAEELDVIEWGRLAACAKKP
ncbi:MAG: 16S rRNA (adenine(1518)-N(6)/adenine(1519)-N(6))-dimethyltransferase RsmA [Acidimicrobiales bacterium]